MVAYARTQKAEAGLSEVRGQPGLHSETLSQTLQAREHYPGREQIETCQSLVSEWNTLKENPV